MFLEYKKDTNLWFYKADFLLVKFKIVYASNH